LTDGIYIQNHMMEGDTTDLKVQYILRDPTVEFVVLETARGGCFWLAFICDIGIITNIQEDHLG
jgi:cyanophycin synthetase